MLHLEEAHLDRITEAFHRILKGEAPPAIALPPDYPEDEYRQMVTYINQFVDEYKEFGRFVFALARGNLAEAPPKTKMQVAYSFKTLQASLRHLTWQTQQIAAGDFNQKVDFMGDFSEAFNRMTVQLKEAFERIEEQNRQLAEANRLISVEKDRSDKLLHNILPGKVVRELKTTGVSSPQGFESVTVFGDTINTASRMEHCSEPMRINVSHATYLAARSRFAFTPRPVVEIKGKGPMQMYFVETEGSGSSCPPRA
jgi:nitrate/nitrite-specific signal transduction histidine kinase